MLSTHLSFAEIAAEMSLSRNTVSSQAMSVYRKLAVGSRSRRSCGPVSWDCWRDDAPFFM